MFSEDEVARKIDNLCSRVLRKSQQYFFALRIVQGPLSGHHESEVHRLSGVCVLENQAMGFGEVFFAVNQKAIRKDLLATHSSFFNSEIM